MQLRNRINLGFAVTVALALVMGLAGQLALKRNIAGFQKITEETAPGLRVLGEVRGAIFRAMTESISLVLLYASSAPGSAERAAIAEEETELAEAWETLEERVFRDDTHSQGLPLSADELLVVASRRQRSALATEQASADRTAIFSGLLFLAVALGSIGFLLYFGLMVNQRLTLPLSRLQAATVRLAARDDADQAAQLMRMR